MLKVLIIIGVILAIFSTMSLLLPDSFTSAIDSSIIYFLSSLWGLNSIIDVSVLMVCLKILVAFYSGLATFWILYWAVKMIS